MVSGTRDMPSRLQASNRVTVGGSVPLGYVRHNSEALFCGHQRSTSLGPDSKFRVMAQTARGAAQSSPMGRRTQQPQPISPRVMQSNSQGGETVPPGFAPLQALQQQGQTPQRKLSQAPGPHIPQAPQQQLSQVPQPQSLQVPPSQLSQAPQPQL